MVLDFDRPYDVLELSSDVSTELRALSASVMGNAYEEFEPFMGQVRAAQADIPKALRAALMSLREGGRGALLIHGIPLPAVLPPTPLQPFSVLPPFTVGTEPILALLAATLGEPFSYREWDDGLLVHNKYPIEAHRDIQFGSNAVEFLVHTETPFRDPSPDFLALLCVRADPSGVAKTRVSDLVEAIESLPAVTRELLAEPAYAFETDNPSLVVDGRGMTTPLPIIATIDGHPRLQYVDDLVGATVPACDALDAVRGAVAARARDIALRAGDLLLLDNRRVVHGRNAFTPRYDGADRWLQRMLLSASLFREGIPAGGRLVADQRFQNYPSQYQKVLKTR